MHVPPIAFPRLVPGVWLYLYYHKDNPARSKTYANSCGIHSSSVYLTMMICSDGPQVRTDLFAGTGGGGGFFARDGGGGGGPLFLLVKGVASLP
jgi:hypothetical protein